MDISRIKYILANNKKWVVIGIIVLLLIIIGSCIRFIVINTPAEEDLPEPGSVDAITLTSDQQKIYDSYDNDTKELLNIFKSNNWVDDTGNNNLSWNEKQMTERGNENEEYQTYAICTIDKKEEATLEKLHAIYDLTFLYADGKYYHCTFTIRYLGFSKDSGYDIMYFEGKNCFKKATRYTSVQTKSGVTIDGWEQNAEQFLDGHYSQMCSEIQNYLSKYYPQVSSIHWEKNVIIDYGANKVSYIFNLQTSNTQRIMVTYYKDTQSFTIKKTTVVIDSKY